MATTIKRKGYGQVEPNHLSGIVTGQIYAQLPAMYIDDPDSSAVLTPIAQLEQGQFLKYDYANGRCDLNGDGEFMLVYCEEKLYDERKQSHKDFVLKAEDFADKKIYPRLIKTYVGDIYTTNTFKVANTSDSAEVATGVSVDVGTYLQVDSSNGFLDVAGTQSLGSLTGMVWKVVKVYTMPDGTPGVKIQRVQ